MLSIDKTKQKQTKQANTGQTSFDLIFLYNGDSVQA